MSSKRPVLLMAVLLVALAGYLARPQLEELFTGANAEALPPPASQAPAVVLPAANGVSNLTLTQLPDGRWQASVDYAYTGQPARAQIRLVQAVVMPHASIRNGESVIGMEWAKPGTHRYTAVLANPNAESQYLTEKVIGRLFVSPTGDLAQVAVDHRIQWPDPVLAKVEKALADGKPEAVVQQAIALIDTGHRHELQQARSLLQALVDKSPNTDPAYVELARVAMKTNWSPTGLRDAENLITSALQIRPDSANAKILLGYVYAHQGRHRDAENLFTEAAAANPPNLWLWANWGEVLAMQGKDAAAIAKYREAVTRPPTGDTYDRARWDAYSNLLRLLALRNDLDAMEPLLKQRAGEYQGRDCFGVHYARFLVLHRADVARAVDTVRESPSPQCDAGRTRELQGLAFYVTWSQGKDPERAESLRQARAFLPVGPNLFYELASTDRAVPVAQQLLRAGEKIGVQDDRQMDALAYALRNGESAIARRLLRLGANPLAEIGTEKMPAALIPVITRDLESIRLLQRAGVDYTKVRYQGMTAVDVAKGQGDTKLQRLLDPRGGSL